MDVPYICMSHHSKGTEEDVRGLVAILEEGVEALLAEGDGATLGVYHDHLLGCGYSGVFGEGRCLTFPSVNGSHMYVHTLAGRWTTKRSRARTSWTSRSTCGCDARRACCRHHRLSQPKEPPRRPRTQWTRPARAVGVRVGIARMTEVKSLDLNSMCLGWSLVFLFFLLLLVCPLLRSCVDFDLAA